MTISIFSNHDQCHKQSYVRFLAHLMNNLCIVFVINENGKRKH